MERHALSDWTVPIKKSHASHRTFVDKCSLQGGSRSESFRTVGGSIATSRGKQGVKISTTPQAVKVMEASWLPSPQRTLRVIVNSKSSVVNLSHPPLHARWWTLPLKNYVHEVFCKGKNFPEWNDKFIKWGSHLVARRCFIPTMCFGGVISPKTDMKTKVGEPRKLFFEEWNGKKKVLPWWDEKSLAYQEESHQYIIFLNRQTRQSYERQIRKRSRRKPKLHPDWQKIRQRT
jgi:hypothetical protein